MPYHIGMLYQAFFFFIFHFCPGDTCLETNKRLSRYGMSQYGCTLTTCVVELTQFQALISMDEQMNGLSC